ncbi:hypothetical protein VTJ04DRAFT_1963 [Mycothermus thermophilus]|uniref:uncharacterized protein n=1 Tax=Humicola insolens TaxID=85995 RepID=UPI0037436E6F
MMEFSGSSSNPEPRYFQVAPPMRPARTMFWHLGIHCGDRVPVVIAGSVLNNHWTMPFGPGQSAEQAILGAVTRLSRPPPANWQPIAPPARLRFPSIPMFPISDALKTNLQQYQLHPFTTP